MQTFRTISFVDRRGVHASLVRKRLGSMHASHIGFTTELVSAWCTLMSL